MDMLPAELLAHIVGFLGWSDALSLRACNKEIKEKITESELRPLLLPNRRTYLLFKFLATGGSTELATLQWAASVLALSSREIAGCNYQLLRDLAAEGQLDVLQWLHTEYPASFSIKKKQDDDPSLDYIRKIQSLDSKNRNDRPSGRIITCGSVYDVLAMTALEAGKLNVVQWLFQNFSNLIYWSRMLFVIHIACGEVLAYFHEVILETTDESCEDAINNALYDNQTGVLQWLLETFQLENHVWKELLSQLSVTDEYYTVIWLLQNEALLERRHYDKLTTSSAPRFNYSKLAAEALRRGDLSTLKWIHISKRYTIQQRAMLDLAIGNGCRDIVEWLESLPWSKKKGEGLPRLSTMPANQASKWIKSHYHEYGLLPDASTPYYQDMADWTLMLQGGHAEFVLWLQQRGSIDLKQCWSPPKLMWRLTLSGSDALIGYFYPSIIDAPCYTVDRKFLRGQTAKCGLSRLSKSGSILLLSHFVFRVIQTTDITRILSKLPSLQAIECLIQQGGIEQSGINVELPISQYFQQYIKKKNWGEMRHLLLFHGETLAHPEHIDHVFFILNMYRNASRFYSLFSLLQSCSSSACTSLRNKLLPWAMNLHFPTSEKKEEDETFPSSSSLPPPPLKRQRCL